MSFLKHGPGFLLAHLEKKPCKWNRLLGIIFKEIASFPYPDGAFKVLGGAGPAKAFNFISRFRVCSVRPCLYSKYGLAGLTFFFVLLLSFILYDFHDKFFQTFYAWLLLGSSCLLVGPPGAS